MTTSLEDRIISAASRLDAALVQYEQRAGYRVQIEQVDGVLEAGGCIALLAHLDDGQGIGVNVELHADDSLDAVPNIPEAVAIAWAVLRGLRLGFEDAGRQAPQSLA